MSGRWQTISPSQFPWHQDTLDFARRAPNCEPFRAYSNFEFVADDRSLNEVDLLIISRYRILLVERKSRPGEVGGDSHTWIWRGQRARVLRRQPSAAHQPKGEEAGLSAAQATNYPEASYTVHSVLGLFVVANKLLDETVPVAGSHSQPVDRGRATSISRALETVGIRPPQQSRRVGDYQLEQVLAETDFHRDWLAKHVPLTNLRRRLRLHTASARSKPRSTPLCLCRVECLQHVEAV